MRKLVGIDGYAVGQEIQVGHLGLLVGRQSADTPQLQGDHLLSQRHAEILWSADGGLTIRDVGSTNGTWVNGMRVDSSPLSPGDQIEFGSTLFRLVDVPTPSHQGVAASPVDVQIAGGLSAHGGGIAVARDAGDIHSSSAHAQGDYGVAVGRDYFEGDTLEVDLTGFRTARGFARLFLVVGTLIALVGFGLFGYMMLDAFGSFQDVMAQHAECDRNFPLGPERVRCNLNIGLPTIAFVPWGAAGATVMFAGMVVFLIGTMMNRNTDRREERAIRRARAKARR
jgi:hypothetical protein